MLLLDGRGQSIGYCSYQRLTVEGMTHSGDQTRAEYPHGARETVTIDMERLRLGHPTARFVAVVVNAYSGISYDQLHEASVYVADPNGSGTGPGGVAILTAAKLTGKDQHTLAGYVAIDPVRREADGTTPLYHFINCDEGLGAGPSRTVSHSAEAIGKRVLEWEARAAAQRSSEAPAKDVTLALAACVLAAASVSAYGDGKGRVAVLHEPPAAAAAAKTPTTSTTTTTTTTLFECRPGESSVDLALRVHAFLCDSERCQPTLNTDACARLDLATTFGLEREGPLPTLVVLGGPHDDWSHLDRELEPRVRQLTLVDVHSRENKAYATATGARKVDGWQGLRYQGARPYL